MTFKGRLFQAGLLSQHGASKHAHSKDFTDNDSDKALQLARKTLLSVEILNADAAADEQLAGRMLQERTWLVASSSSKIGVAHSFALRSPP